MLSTACCNSKKRSLGSLVFFNSSSSRKRSLVVDATSATKMV